MPAWAETALAELDLVVAAAVEADVPEGFDEPVAAEAVPVLDDDDEEEPDPLEPEEEELDELELEPAPVHWLLANSMRFAPSEPLHPLVESAHDWMFLSWPVPFLHMHVQSLFLQLAVVKRLLTHFSAQEGTPLWAMTRPVKRLATRMNFMFVVVV